MFGLFTIWAGLFALLASVAEPTVPEVGPAPELELEQTVYLRNYYLFTEGRESMGASASLIALNDGVYALTAKHLLGEAMGITPEVRPSDLEKALLSWSFYTNEGFYGDPAPVAQASGVHRPMDEGGGDILVLSVDAIEEAGVLSVSPHRAGIGDHVYLVGCTYAEGAACSQNIYAGSVVSRLPDLINGGQLILFELEGGAIELSGFSGAPVLNENSEVVAVLVSSYDGLAVAAVLPDWMREAAS